MTRLNNAPGNQVTATYVIKNPSQNHSWNISGSRPKAMSHGFIVQRRLQLRRVKEPGRAVVHGRQLVGIGNPIVIDPNNPPLANSLNSPGHRVFLAANYRKQYFDLGATTVSVFYDGHTNGNTSYVFAGDANGDTVSGNDLIYIPRDTSEMNFRPLTRWRQDYTGGGPGGGVRAYIQNDTYLSSHRGQYAERGAVFLPMVNRVDLSIMQDVFTRSAGTEARRPDSPRHHELRQPAEPQLGRRPADRQHPDPDQPGGRRAGHTQLPDADVNGNLLTTPLQTTAGTPTST